MKRDIKVRDDDLTIEEIKALETFQNWPDEQIMELINAMKIFAEISYELWLQQESKNGKIIALESDSNRKTRAA